MSFLKKLFAKKTAEPADVPPEFLQTDAPDWLIDLKGKPSPDGNAFSIRVQLFQSLRTGVAEIVVLLRHEAGQPVSAATDLVRTEIDKLFVILGFSFPDDIASVASNAGDGLPVSVSIYRRDPFTLRAADCNLAGWLDSKKSGPPAVEICRLLLEARNRALPS